MSDAEVHGLLASCGAEPDAQAVSASALRRIWAASLIEATPDSPQRSPTYKYSASVRQAQMQSDLSFLSPSEEKLVPITTPNPLMVALHQKCLTDKSSMPLNSSEAASPHASPVKPTSPRSYLRKKSAEKRAAAATDGGSRTEGSASVRLRLAQSPPPRLTCSEVGDGDYDNDCDDDDGVGSVRSGSSRGSSPARPRLKLHRGASPTPSEESTRTFQEVRASSMPTLCKSSSEAAKGRQSGLVSPPRTAAGAGTGSAKNASEANKDKKGLGFGRSLTPPSSNNKTRSFLRKGQGTGGGNNTPSRTAGATSGSSVDRGGSSSSSSSSSSSGSSSGDAATDAPHTPISPQRGGSLNRLPGSDGSRGHSGGKSGDYFDPLGLFADHGGDNDSGQRRQQKDRRGGSPPGRSHSPPGKPPIGFKPFVVTAQYSPARSSGSASSTRQPGISGGGSFSTSKSPGRTPTSSSKARSSLVQQRQQPSPWQSPPRRTQRYVDESKINPPVEESVVFVGAKSPLGRPTGTPDGSPPPAEGTLSSLEEDPLNKSSKQRGRTTSATTGKTAGGGAGPPSSSSSFSPSAARRGDASSLRAGSLSKKLDELQEFYQASLSGSSPSTSVSGLDNSNNNSASSTPVHERSPSRAPHPASSAAARARIAATNSSAGKSRAARLVLEAQESLRASSMPPPQSTIIPTSKNDVEDGFGEDHSAFGEDSSAFGDKEEGTEPTQSSRAGAGNRDEAERTGTGATGGPQEASSSGRDAASGHPSSSQQMEVRHHPRYREFYHMRWKLNVEARVVGQQMAQIGLDPEVVLSDRSGTRLLPLNDLAEKHDLKNNSGMNDGDVDSKQAVDNELQGNEAVAVGQDSSSQSQQKVPQEPQPEMKKEAKKASSQPESSPPKLMPLSMVGTPQRSAFSLLTPSPTPGITPSPGIFPASPPGSVPPPRLVSSPSNLALTSPSRAHIGDIIDTSSSSSSAAETASLHAQLALEQQRRREAEARLEQSISVAAKLDREEDANNGQIALKDSLDAAAVRRLQLERHEATRAAVAAETTAQNSQAKALQLSHALAEAEQQRARAIEAHTAAEAENVELRRAVASEQEDKRAALAFRTAVEQEHAAAWAAAQKEREAEAAAQQAGKTQQEAELASQIKAHREALEYLEVAHAKKLTALQHQCRDLSLQVEKAQQELANSEATREDLLKREKKRRVADVAEVEAKAQAEAEKHEASSLKMREDAEAIEAALVAEIETIKVERSEQMKSNADLEASVATLRQELTDAHEAHTAAQAALEQQATNAANEHARALNEIKEALRVASIEAESSQQREQRRRVVDGAALAAAQATLETAREEHAFDTATIASLRADLARESTDHAEALDSSLFGHLEDVQALKAAHDAAMEAERNRAVEQARAAEETHRVELAELEDLHQARLDLERSSAASQIAKEVAQAQERTQKVVLTRLLHRVGKGAPLMAAWLAWQRYASRAAMNSLAQSYAAEKNRASEDHATQLKEELALYESSVLELRSKISSSVSEVEARERAEALRLLQAAQSESQAAMSAAQIAREEERKLEATSRAVEIKSLLEERQNVEEESAQAVACANDNTRACTMRYMLRRIGYGAPLASAWSRWVRQTRAIATAALKSEFEEKYRRECDVTKTRVLKHITRRIGYGAPLISAWSLWVRQTRAIATVGLKNEYEERYRQERDATKVRVLKHIVRRIGYGAPLISAWSLWVRQARAIATVALKSEYDDKICRERDAIRTRVLKHVARRIGYGAPLGSAWSLWVRQTRAIATVGLKNEYEERYRQERDATKVRVLKHIVRRIGYGAPLGSAWSLWVRQARAIATVALKSDYDDKICRERDAIRTRVLKHVARRIGYGAPLGSAWSLWVRRTRAMAALAFKSFNDDKFNHQHRCAVARTLKHVIRRFRYGLLSVSMRQWDQQTRTAATNALADAHASERRQDHQSVAVATFQRFIHRCLHTVPLLAAWRSWTSAIASIKTSAALTSAMVAEARKEHAKMAARMVKRAAHRFSCQSCVAAAWHTWVRYMWAQRVVDGLVTRYTSESELAAAAAASEVTTAAQAAKDANVKELSALHAMEMAAQRAKFEASLVDLQADHAAALALTEGQAAAAADAQSEAHARKIAEVERSAQAQIAAASKAKHEEESAARDAATIEALKQELHALEDQVRNSATAASNADGSRTTASMGAKVQRAAAAAAAEAATAAAAAERGRLAIVEKKRAALMEEKHAQQVAALQDELHFYKAQALAAADNKSTNHAEALPQDNASEAHVETTRLAQALEEEQRASAFLASQLAELADATTQERSQLLSELNNALAIVTRSSTHDPDDTNDSEAGMESILTPRRLRCNSSSSEERSSGEDSSSDNGEVEELRALLQAAGVGSPNPNPNAVSRGNDNGSGGDEGGKDKGVVSSAATTPAALSTMVKAVRRGVRRACSERDAAMIACVQQEQDSDFTVASCLQERDEARSALQRLKRELDYFFGAVLMVAVLLFVGTAAMQYSTVLTEFRDVLLERVVDLKDGLAQRINANAATLQINEAATALWVKASSIHDRMYQEYFTHVFNWLEANGAFLYDYSVAAAAMLEAVRQTILAAIAQVTDFMSAYFAHLPS